MRRFIDRAKANEIGVNVIDLDKSEYSHYHGCGEALVQTNKNGAIENIHYLHQIETTVELDNMIDRAFKRGDTYVGSLSCFQLFDFELLDATPVFNLIDSVKLIEAAILRVEGND